MLTEEESKQKLCPLSSDPCEGQRCMWWRWALDGIFAEMDVRRDGYCGAAGRPGS